MKFGKFLVIAISVLVSFKALSQITFTGEQENIFAISENQFLSQQLKSNNASHFKCNGSNIQWTLPSDSCRLFDTRIYISSEHRENFKQLIFPGGDCKRYVALISLCDLYFPLFRRECQAAQIHDDFKILPLLLSGCNASHEDKNGKTGLWNLDYLVARKYHLRVDSVIDERKGGDFTTHAAVGYLAELSKKFEDDSFRTLIAYQRGVPNAQNLGDDLQHENLLDATDEYMNTFIQFYAYMAELIASTRAENQLNNYFDIMAQFEPLNAEREVKYQALTEILQQDSQALKQFNAVYTGSYIPTGYRRVPFMIDRVASLRFEALSDSVYNWQPKTTPATDPTAISEMILFHKVKRGESLGQIAAKYHVSISQIKKWNRIKSNKITRGQSLKIIRNVAPVEIELKPAVTKPLTEAKVVTSESEELVAQIKKLEQEAQTFISKNEYQKAVSRYEEILLLADDKEIYKKKIRNTRKLQDAKTEPGKITYTVKSGDSLWTIAMKYPGVTDKDIMKWNKCNAHLRPGQKLIIYTK